MAEHTHTRLLTATRTLGALSLFVVAGVHFQQYQYDFYSTIPTIGPLFLANFVGAAALGLFLLAPARLFGRFGTILDRLAALAGIGLAAGAFVGLVISEQTPLFGFMEHGYRFAIVLALASEAVTIVLLAIFLIAGRPHRSASMHERSGKRRRESTGQPAIAPPANS